VRANIFRQRGTVALVLRVIHSVVPPLTSLGLPEMVAKLTQLERGLVLVTGASGSGKTTTLAALVNEVNLTQTKHVLTIEDPIEFLFAEQKSLITQREIGVDAPTFHEAMRAALREDPDVILLGEMRDIETIETALQAAETGHFVLATAPCPSGRRGRQSPHHGVSRRGPGRGAREGRPEPAGRGKSAPATTG